MIRHRLPLLSKQPPLKHPNRRKVIPLPVAYQARDYHRGRRVSREQAALIVAVCAVFAVAALLFGGC